METEPQQNFGPHWEVAARSIISPKPETLPENQDNYLLIDSNGLALYQEAHQACYQQLENWPAGYGRVAVMDGMGGHSSGRQVAEAVAKGLLQIPATDNINQLSEQLLALHQQLQQQFHADSQHPGCTLTLLELQPDGDALLYHVGDSRLYRINPQHADCLTVDHVPDTRQAINNQISETDWRQGVFNQFGHIISQAFVLGGDLSGKDQAADSLYELSDSNLPHYLQGLGDRRRITSESDTFYLLGTDGLWARQAPQPIIDNWPNILYARQGKLNHLLDDIFFDLALRYEEDVAPDYEKDPYAREEHLDNCTGIALRRLS